MSDDVRGANLGPALEALAAGIDAISRASLSSSAVADLKAGWRVLQAAQTRLRLAQLDVLAELDGRQGADGFSHGLGELAEIMLHTDRRDAARLVGDLNDFGTRRSLTGPALLPQFPLAAAALAEGAMSFSQARVISGCLTGLPSGVRAEHGERVEAVLTEQARTLTATQLRKLARRVVGYLDPDGPAPAVLEQTQHDRRAFSWQRQSDGTVTGRFTLTAETAAIWETLLTPLAARHPTTDTVETDEGTITGDQNEHGGSGEDVSPAGAIVRTCGVPADPLASDRRTAQQRWHDAFADAGRRLLTARDIPEHAGLPATLLITMSLTDLERRAGSATTQHGGSLSIAQALQLATDASVLPLIMNDSGGIVDHGRERRLASRRQRLALIARDRGCTFPGCPKPAADAQAHHLTSWADGGPTDLANLALACGYHNNHAPRWGWTSTLSDGVAYWTAPRWLDPDRTPRRNYQHHPELLLTRTTPAPPTPGPTTPGPTTPGPTAAGARGASRASPGTPGAPPAALSEKTPRDR